MFDRDVFVVCLGDTAALEGLGQRDRQPVADCRDQVSGMTLRWNDAAAGGWDDWVFELFRRGGGWGESQLVRSRGNHKRQFTKD